MLSAGSARKIMCGLVPAILLAWELKRCSTVCLCSATCWRLISIQNIHISTTYYKTKPKTNLRKIKSWHKTIPDLLDDHSLSSQTSPFIGIAWDMLLRRFSIRDYKIHGPFPPGGGRVSHQRPNNRAILGWPHSHNHYLNVLQGESRSLIKCLLFLQQLLKDSPVGPRVKFPRRHPVQGTLLDLVPFGSVNALKEKRWP